MLTSPEKPGNLLLPEKYPLHYIIIFLNFSLICSSIMECIWFSSNLLIHTALASGSAQTCSYTQHRSVHSHSMCIRLILACSSIWSVHQAQPKPAHMHSTGLFIHTACAIDLLQLVHLHGVCIRLSTHLPINPPCASGIAKTSWYTQHRGQAQPNQRYIAAPWPNLLNPYKRCIRLVL